MNAKRSKLLQAKADTGSRSEAVPDGRVNMGPDEDTIDRWVERGFVPAVGRGITGPFTGFPPIVETELLSVSVELVDD
jgi:hypothetical protein